MPIVNYVREHIRFMEYASDEHLTASERLLWYALMHIMNQRAQGNFWPDEFIRISNDRLLSYCPMKFDTMANARNGLKQRGLIEVEKGEKNKKSPAYRMIYFYPQYVAPSTERDGARVYPNIPGKMGFNPNIPDYMGGNTGDNMGDNMGGNPGGNMGDIYINYKDIHRGIPERNPGSPEEDISDDNNHKGPRGTVSTENLEAMYPSRTRSLSEEELRLYFWINDTLSDNEGVCEMYGLNGRRIICTIAKSDAYPLALVAYAIEKTVTRNRNYRLDNPAAYTVTLLNDWRDQGFETREDVQEAKDDWWHYN